MAETCSKCTLIRLAQQRKCRLWNSILNLSVHKAVYSCLLSLVWCSDSSQVGKACVEHCPQFDGFRIAYRLEVPDKNVSADVQSCHSAVSITQAPDEMWGLLYVNDTEELRRPECQDLQYLVVAKEQHTQLETSMQIQIILDNEGEQRPF